MNSVIPTEDQECKAFVQWLELLIRQGRPILFTHLANETFTKSWKQKNRNKAMGVRAGFPDYVLIVNMTLIVIEMKRQKTGKLSEAQKFWILRLQECGTPVYVCKGFDEAKKAIESYL